MDDNGQSPILGDDELFGIDLAQTIKVSGEGKPDIFHNPFSSAGEGQRPDKKAKAAEMEYNPFERQKRDELSPVREDDDIEIEPNVQLKYKPYDAEERLRQLGILKLKPKRNSIPAY